MDRNYASCLTKQVFIEINQKLFSTKYGQGMLFLKVFDLCVSKIQAIIDVQIF